MTKLNGPETSEQHTARIRQWMKDAALELKESGRSELRPLPGITFTSPSSTKPSIPAAVMPGKPVAVDPAHRMNISKHDLLKAVVAAVGPQEKYLEAERKEKEEKTQRGNFNAIKAGSAPDSNKNGKGDNALEHQKVKTLSVPSARIKTERSPMSTKIIIGVWTLIVFIMCFIPPWMHTIKTRDFEKTISAGYHAFYVQLRQYNDYSSVKIDWQRLILQIFGITALTGGSLLIKSRWRLWKLQVENKILEKQVEQFALKNKLNELKEDTDEI